jgi:hypothetical protein
MSCLQVTINGTIYVFYIVQTSNTTTGGLNSALYVCKFDMKYNKLDLHSLLFVDNGHLLYLGNVVYDETDNTIIIIYQEGGNTDGTTLKWSKMDLNYNIISTENLKFFEWGTSEGMPNLYAPQPIFKNVADNKKCVCGIRQYNTSYFIMRDKSIKTISTSAQSCAALNPFENDDIVTLKYKIDIFSSIDSIYLVTSENEYLLVQNMVPQGITTIFDGLTLFQYNNELYILYCTFAPHDQYSTIELAKIALVSGEYVITETHTTVLDHAIQYPYNNFSIAKIQDGLVIYGAIDGKMYRAYITDDAYNIEFAEIGELPENPAVYLNILQTSNLKPNEIKGIFQSYASTNPFIYEFHNEYSIDEGNGSDDKTKIYLELQSLNSTNIKIPFTVPTPVTYDGSEPQWLLHFRCKIYANEACTDLIVQLDTIDNADSFKLENNINFPLNGLLPSKYGTKLYVLANIRPVNKIYVVLDYGAETY